jgi:hypothetical protein
LGEGGGGVEEVVVVAVQHEPAVIAGYPAGAGFDVVGVVVEEDGGTCDADCFYAVAVQVDG